MKPRIDRLEKVLKALPKRETKRGRFNLKDFLTVEKCGTTACALGWYRYKHRSVRLGYFDRSHGDLGGWVSSQDAMPHFNISYEDARHLFWSKRGPGSRLHNSLRGTRARIRAFINKHKEQRA